MPFDNSAPHPGRVTLRIGDCLDVLRTLQARTIQTCVTSPPYFQKRDYEHAAQIGREATVAEYVENLVRVMREVRRVLRDDGTLWLNLADSYSHQKPAKSARPSSLKAKDLMMLPARVALALQDDGWWLRSDIIWHKLNLMPESITDRPTSAHEHIFLLTKQARYFYDAEAVQEPMAAASAARYSYAFGGPKNSVLKAGDNPTAVVGERAPAGGRNLRNVWTVASHSFGGAHFATMPPRLAERCIRAGSKVGDTVLDPFSGSETTGLVASQIGRDAILIDLNAQYIEMARERITGALKQHHRRRRRAGLAASFIERDGASAPANRILVTGDAENLVTISDLSAGQVKARARFRRAAAVYRDKARRAGDRLLTLWVHESRTPEFQAEALRQSQMIGGGLGGMNG